MNDLAPGSLFPGVSATGGEGYLDQQMSLSQPMGGAGYLDRIARQEGWRNAYLLGQADDDPDTLAEALWRSRRSGVAPQAILADMDGFREQMRLSDIADATYGTPALSAFLQDPMQRGLANDDVFNLAGIERFLDTQFGRGLQTGVTTGQMMAAGAAAVPFQVYRSVGGNTVDAFAEIVGLEGGGASPDQVGQAVRGIAQEYGIALESEAFQNIVDFATGSPERRAELTQEIVERVRSNDAVVKSMTDQIEAFQREMVRTQGRVLNFTDIDDAKAFADWLAFSTGQAVPLLAAGVLASLAPGGGLAFGYGMGIGDINSTLLEQGIDAPGAAVAGGLPYALLERVGAPAQIATALKGVAPDVLQSAFKRWAVRKGVQVSRAAFGEFVNEAGQAIIADYTVDFAGGEDVALDSETFLAWFNEGMAGAAGGAAISVFAPTPRAAEDQPGESPPPPSAPPVPPAPVISPEQRTRFENAGTTAEMLASLDALAQEARLKERDPETFETFVGGVTQGEASLYVPAEDLREYAQGAALDTGSLGVTTQAMADAIETGGLVAVPVEKYMALVSGTDAAAWFRENAVTRPDAEMSLAEQARDGRRIMEEARSEVAKIEAELDRLEDGERRIYDTVRDQLREAGRSPDVASSEATFFTAFFRSMASRYGGDAYALFERFSARFQDGSQPGLEGMQEGAGGATLMQGDDGAVELAQGRQQVEVDGISLDLNDDGTVTLYHGTTADGAAGIRGEGMLRSAAEPSVYLTTDPTAAPGYGDGTVVAVNVDPALLRIDDEFPDGRADFAIDASEVSVSFPAEDPRILFQGGRQQGPILTDEQSQSIRDMLRNRISDRPHVAEVPAALGALIGDSRMLAIPAGVLWKAGSDKHGFTDSQMLQAINALSDPRLVFDSAQENGNLVAIVDVDGIEQPVAVVVDPARRVANRDIAAVVSIHRKDNPRSIAQWAKDGLLRYRRTKYADAFPNSVRRYLPMEGIVHRHNEKILTAADVFKSRTYDQNPGDDGRRGSIQSGVEGWSEAAAVALRALADKGDNEAIVAQALVNGAGLGPQDFSNILEGVSGLSEAERLGSIEGLALPEVLVLMRAAVLENPQVLDAVVGSVPVDMVNLLAGSKGAAKMLLHDEAMLENGSAFDADLPITEAVDRSRTVRLFVLEAASLAAERALSVANAGREADEARAAVVTGKGNALGQDDTSGRPRANIQIPAAGVTSGRTVINLFENRNLSSIIHESGHYFYEVFSVLASEADAPRQMKDDLAKLQAWMGVEPGATPSTEAHEKMARGMERYVMEGKAPSAELAAVFGRFRAWLTNIYRTVRGLNVELTPEVRGVFDRMLATEEEIQQVQADLAMSPLFAEAPAGMSAEAWEIYQRTARARAEEANTKLLTQKMEAIRKRREAWWKDERKARVQAEMDQLAQDRVYRAIEMLANRVWIGAEGEGDVEIPDVRLDRAELVETFGADVLQELAPAKFGMTRAIYTTANHPNAMSLAEAAEVFGFGDVETMIQELRGAGSRKAQAEASADTAMREQYDDVLSEDDMRAEALDAAHSERQAEMTVMELRHIMTARGRDARSATTRAFKLRARTMLGRMQVRYAQNPAGFLQAERRAAKAAEAAFARAARGGARSEAALAEAQQAKEQQLLNQYLYAEARAFQEKLDTKRGEMSKYSRSAETRKRIGSPHIEQIDAILEGYEFKKKSQKDLDRRQSFLDYVAQMEAEGRIAEMQFDPTYLSEARRKNYSRLTVDEVSAVFDAVDNIAHIGRRTRELVIGRNKRLLKDVAERVAGQIRKNQKSRGEARSGIAKGLINSLSRVDTIAVRMDGGEELGGFHEEIKRPIDEASVEENRRTVEGMERLEEIFLRHYTRAELKAMGKKKEVPGAGIWSKEEIVSIALNTGTESGWQRLMDPKVPELRRMTDARINALLSTLTETDWRFVQDIWNFQEGYWPELAEVEQRRTGVRPQKVDARSMWPGAPSFVTGGYYRLYYDSTRSGAAAADHEMHSAFEGMSAGWGAKAQVGNGMTIARMQSARGRPILFEFSTIPKQMREVVRLITMAEAVDAADRILKTPEVRTAMEDTGNLDTLDTLNLWLRDVAAGPLYNSDGWSRLARTAKNNFTLMQLGFNLKTVLLQATGLTQASVTIGHKHMVMGLARYARNPARSMQDTLAKSPFMRERMQTFQKDIYDFRNSQKIASPVMTGASRVMDVIAKASFVPITWMQFYAVDLPVWRGAFEGALNEGKSEQDAVYYADRMVARSQDSALMADRAAIERGTLNRNTRQSHIVQLFTTLGGYMMTKMNRANVQILKRQMQIREADSPALRVAIAARLASDLIILYTWEAAIIALVNSWLSDDEEPEEVANLILKETGFTMVGGIPVVRDGLAAFQGFEAGGVYGGSLGTFGKAYTQIKQGELDDPALRAALNVVGISTGLPTTASYRIIEQFIGDDDASIAEALLGRNPLDR